VRLRTREIVLVVETAREEGLNDAPLNWLGVEAAKVVEQVI
jgi:hypothetical protein